MTQVRAPHVVCPVCGSSRREDYEVVAVAKPRRLREEAAVLRCRQHGIELLDAAPRSYDSARPPMATERDHRSAQREQVRFGSFMRMVERVATPPGRLHDIGCGVGGLLSVAASRGWSVQGNELNETLATMVAAAGYTCMHGTLAELAIPSGSCDVVTSYCVVPNHLTEPNADLRQVLSMLRPGGWFVLELPSDGVSLKLAKALYRLSGRRWSWVMGHFYNPGHPLRYSPASIELHLRRIGFAPVVAGPFRHSPHCSTSVLRRKVWWKRIPAVASVYLAHAVSFLPGQANHMVVHARRPPDVA